jgi:hypothetical protein
MLHRIVFVERSLSQAIDLLTFPIPPAALQCMQSIHLASKFGSCWVSGTPKDHLAELLQSITRQLLVLIQS